MEIGTRSFSGSYAVFMMWGFTVSAPTLASTMV